MQASWLSQLASTNLAESYVSEWLCGLLLEPKILLRSVFGAVGWVGSSGGLRWGARFVGALSLCLGLVGVGRSWLGWVVVVLLGWVRFLLGAWGTFFVCWGVACCLAVLGFWVGRVVWWGSGAGRAGWWG